MSTAARSRRWLDAAVSPRSAALVGVAALTAGYVSTLYWVTTIAGGTAWLAGGLAVALGAAVLLRDTEERTVLAIAGAGAVLGGGWYYATASPTIGVGTVVRVVGDTLAMASGISVLGLAAVDVWIAAVTPVPVFVSAYLAIRGRYVLATVAGGWFLCFLALTGDATAVETLVGALGAVTVVGFGELDRRDGSLASADLVVAMLAGMAVLALTVPLVPAGQSGPLDPRTGLAGDRPGSGGPQGLAETPLDDQVLTGGDFELGGPINLSTEVRFVVHADQRRRWRVGSFDHYTGRGWHRTGSGRPYTGSLLGPQGPSRTLEQTVDLRTESGSLPAAAYPVDVDGPAADVAMVSSTGTLGADGRLGPEDDYRVTSEVPTPTTQQLEDAGTQYPVSIERRYTQLPDDVPDRVGNLTDQVTSQADTPYETAVAIEASLEDTHAYSQNVSAPEGDVVDAFLFEMDAGYCTYYASSMAAMLRTQGVPARVAVGYNGGQWAGNDTWVVREADAHAWVEVYFPDVGWVEFDPTPAREWRDARRDAVTGARENGSSTVDVPESEGRDVRFEAPDPDGGNGTTGGNGTDGGNGTATNGSAPGGQASELYSGIGQPVLTNDSGPAYVEPNVTIQAAQPSETNGSVGPARPTGARVFPGVDARFLAALLVAGGVAGARRTRAGQRVRRSARLVWQRRRSPESDVERAVQRLDLLLARRHRPRDPTETRREYVRSLGSRIDDRVRRAVELHERARYAGEADEATADELVGLVDDLVAEELGPVARLGR